MNYQFRFLATAGSAAVLATGLLAGCGGDGDTGSSSVKANTAAPTAISKDVVEAAQAEGKVVVYGNPPEDMWKRLIPNFRKVYPGIEVEAVDISGPDLVQRYLSEEKTEVGTADLVIDSSTSTFFSLEGHLEERTSVVEPDLPDFAKPGAGMYAFAADPSIIVYNKSVLSGDEVPESLADVTSLAKKYSGKLTTYDTSNDNGYGQMWTFADQKGDAAWELYDTLAPATRNESSGGTMVQKLAQGEYVAGYFQSGLVRGLLEPMGLSEILGWSYGADGTTVVPRYAAVTNAAEHPNAAALLQDYLLSAEGQTVVCASGLTAVRDDVESTCGDFSLTSITSEVGEDNMFIVPLDQRMYDEKADFEARLESAQGE